MKKKIFIILMTVLVTIIIPVSGFEINNNIIVKTSFDERVVSLIQQLDETIYLGYLENLTAFGPKVTSSKACEEAGDYIYNEFVSIGLESRYHEWISSSYDGKNIEGTEKKGKGGWKRD